LRLNQEIAMRIARFNISCRKTTLAGSLAALGLQALFLGWSGPAGAQDAANNARLSTLLDRAAVSENATSPVNVSHPSSFDINRRIDPVAHALPAGASHVDATGATPLGNTGNNRKGPAQTFSLGQSRSAVIHGRNIGGAQKITATSMADAPHASSVTLWDEILPPKPAPVPIGAAQPAPGSVTSSSNQ
jgi:hypothetical protein